jgi:hypothetical protein
VGVSLSQGAEPLSQRLPSRGVTLIWIFLVISHIRDNPITRPRPSCALLTPITVAREYTSIQLLAPAVFFNSHSILSGEFNCKALTPPSRQTGSITPPTSAYPLCRSLTTTVVTAYPFREGEETSLEEEVRKGVRNRHREETFLPPYAPASKKYPSVHVESRARLEQQWQKLEPSERAGV